MHFDQKRNQEILKEFNFGEVFKTCNRSFHNIQFNVKHCKNRNRDPLPKDFEYLKRLENIFISLSIVSKKDAIMFRKGEFTKLEEMFVIFQWNIKMCVMYCVDL